MSTALRPVLRPSTLPSLPSPTTTSTTTTYICQTCRHARLLRRPKRPYTFTQLVALSDGSAFTLRTTSPQPVYRSTRDTRNSPLWNPSSRELLNVEDDESGRLSGFRARFGKQFDLQREAPSGEETQGPGGDAPVSAEAEVQVEGKEQASPGSKGPFFQGVTETKHARDGSSAVVVEDEYYEFEEDDANLLDLISSYGQDSTTGKAEGKKDGKKDGKK